VVRLVSVNCLNLYGGGDAALVERHARVEELIAGVGADIVAVQEIVADGDQKAAEAGRGLRRLAEVVGLDCEVDGQPVLAVGGGIHHVGLLWRPRAVTPVAGSVKRFTRENAGMWHSLVTAVFDVGGQHLRVASVQLSPFDQGWGVRDASQVMRALNSDRTPGVVGGDFNGLGATTVPTPEGGQAYYDRDPYQDVTWHPDHAYQLDADDRVERAAAVRLERVGRMRDCARIVGAPWEPTTGFHPDDAHPPRRIDRWYATYHCPDAAVIGYEVIPPRMVALCSDHLPVAVEVDPAALVA
jgi:endonuclease/exonuclease/phosphatase family metal-dependent hydrolase